MAVTYIVSGEATFASLRYVWIALAAQALASWGLFLSMILPMIQQHRDPPLAVETFASRYRLLTPETPKARAKRSHGYSTVASTFCKSAALTSSRSHSSSSESCSSARGNASHKGSPLRARRCTTIAAGLISRPTRPVRPIIKRGYTAIQRSFSFVESSDGMAPAPRTLMQVARTRTKLVINRSASVATAAFATASHVVTPMRNTNIYADGSSDEGDDEGERALESDASPVAASPLRMPRPMMRPRRLTSVRFLSRFQDWSGTSIAYHRAFMCA